MYFKTDNKPTSAQIAALRFYAQTHGRTWKSKLRQSWMTGIYDDRDNSRELQLVRNSLGPTWLTRFKLPALICYKCELPITDSCYMGNEDGTFNHLNACPQPKPEKPKKLEHFISGSGMYGCLYDNGPNAHDTYQGAVDSLAQLFELGRTRKSRLFADRYLTLRNDKDGAQYCQITTCDCSEPWEHNEDDSPEDWPDYPQPISCDQCEMLSINHVACHEHGCPNMGARWDAESQNWIKQRKCFDCGCEVDATDPCCSAPCEDDEDHPATFGDANVSTHNIDIAYARACGGHCADCGMSPEECFEKPCPYNT